MPQPLTDAINALTTYANTVTGASDTTLSDAVATLASGYGGALQLVDTITVTEASRSIDIQLAPYSSYNYLFFYIDCTTSSTEWIYVNPNISAPATPAYTWIGPSAGATTFKQVFAFYANQSTNTILIRFTERIYNNSSITNIYLNTYTASSTFNVGSEIRIYTIDESNL